MWRDPALALYVAVPVVAAVQIAVLDVRLGRTVLATLPFVVAAAVIAAGRRFGAGERRGRRWLVGLASGEVVLAAWATVAFVRALPAGMGEPSGFYRVKVLVTTPLGDHNTAAAFLVVGVVATVVLARDDQRWWAGTAVTTLGLVACLSRGAAIVLLLAGLGGLVARVRPRVALAVAAAGLVSVAAITGLAVALDASPPVGEGAAVDPDGPVGASVAARADLVGRGLALTRDHPLLGVGLGGFGDRATDLPPPNGHAHNTVAHAGAEGGVPLAAIAVGLATLLAVRALRLPSGWRRDLTVLGGAALVGHSQLDIVWGTLGAEALLAALLVLAAPGAGTGRDRR